VAATGVHECGEEGEWYLDVENSVNSLEDSREVAFSQYPRHLVISYADQSPPARIVGSGFAAATPRFHRSYGSWHFPPTSLGPPPRCKSSLSHPRRTFPLFTNSVLIVLSSSLHSWLEAILFSFFFLVFFFFFSPRLARGGSKALPGHKMVGPARENARRVQSGESRGLAGGGGRGQARGSGKRQIDTGAGIAAKGAARAVGSAG
jgi:hypothetical protein